MFPEKIESKRLILRRPENSEEFAKTMFRAIDNSRKELQIWLNWVDDTKSYKDSYNFINMVNEKWNKKTSFEYAIFNKKNNEFIGIIGTPNYYKTDKRIEFGYWQYTKHTGNGYIQEAAKALEEKAFECGIKRIEIKTDVENIKSSKIPERLGFELECIAKKLSYNPYFDECRNMNIYVKIK